jgi:hypothetical protein
MIDKDAVAEVFGLSDSDDISDSVYTWAVKQFFLLTGLQASEVKKVYRKLLQSTTSTVKLPYTNIKQIDSIKIDNVSQDFTLHSDLKFNPDTGILWYATGFGGGQLAEVTYTLNGFASEDIHDYLVALLVAKAMSLFTPEKIAQVKMIKIGSFQKQYGSSASNLEDYQIVLEKEISHVVDQINGDDGKMSFELIQ